MAASQPPLTGGSRQSRAVFDHVVVGGNPSAPGAISGCLDASDVAQGAAAPTMMKNGGGNQKKVAWGLLDSDRCSGCLKAARA